MLILQMYKLGKNNLVEKILNNAAGENEIQAEVNKIEQNTNDYTVLSKLYELPKDDAQALIDYDLLTTTYKVGHRNGQVLYDLYLTSPPNVFKTVKLNLYKLMLERSTLEEIPEGPKRKLAKIQFGMCERYFDKVTQLPEEQFKQQEQHYFAYATKQYRGANIKEQLPRRERIKELHHKLLNLLPPP